MRGLVCKELLLAARQEAAGGPWGYGCWGAHGGRRRIWKDSHADPMVRGQELGIAYAGCKWSPCSLRPRTGEKRLVETAAALAGEQGG